MFAHGRKKQMEVKMKNYLDGWIHAIGVATINKVVPDSKDDSLCKAEILFKGGELTLSIPRDFLYETNGMPKFKEDDDAWIDLRLGINAQAKTFEGNAYTKIDITVKKVLEFRKLTDQEAKAV